ncbi:Tat (twin-arginine translocation) pathway signal sequence [Pseudomonas saponiphila]|uniref:Tat (Twin-arginine translocation) pathway signal sequence n=1 Tax=Pseudomonas saponiphila TaxID=556534 RepID=A0A1H4ZUJ9_9PSED|nr:twin-arginine translocation signal domain-containing protein [Pseudomonas saponiphila]SED33141.1 Tat (twin-arginine translocation) pathway signal sequence [Pseudomonas saponiphila]
MDFTRRKFMKMTAAGAAAMSLGFGVRTPEAQASAASIATFLSIDPVTLAYKIFSSCCYYCMRISEHRDRPFRLIVTGHFANA